jgi:flagellar hook protein FlgE
MALIGTMGSGISALRTFEKGLEVIGNNIANVNTTGFKSSSAKYADSFSNVLARSAAGASASSVSIGTGVNLSGISANFSSGSLTSTGKVTDLGISGNGFFRVKNSADSSEFVTRAGDFRWDINGYLVTTTGLRVQGVNGTAIGDIKLSDPTTISSVSIDKGGNVVEFLNDGTSQSTCKILLQNFTDPSALTKEGDNLYSGMTAAGSTSGSDTLLTTGENDAGTNGLGTIQSGSLEQSNVDLTEQFSDLITTQRAFQAGSRLITVSDTILEDIVNLKR